MWPLTAVTLGMHPVTLIEHVGVTTSGVEQQSLANVKREIRYESGCVLADLCSLHSYHVSNTLEP